MPLQRFYTNSEHTVFRFAAVNQTQHSMKTILMLNAFLLISNILFAQVAGNANYNQKVRIPTQNIYDNNLNAGYGSDKNFTLILKGLHNVKTSAYVAIFSLTQSGKTVKEVNKLIDSRLDKVKSGVKQIAGAVLHLDMISFVPQYEYEVEKKIFSKKTYHEIPKGFEIKKNIHIKYTQPSQLNRIIAKCAEAGIYDLVRVDYFSENLVNIKRNLRAKVIAQLQQKLLNYQGLLGVDMKGYQKQLADGFKVVYPVEMYHTYQAHSSSSIHVRRNAKVNQINKTTTQYYQPIVDKEFDLVINPVITEPVIQVMYQVNFTLKKVKKTDPKPGPTKIVTQKRVMLITPSGQVKELNIR